MLIDFCFRGKEGFNFLSLPLLSNSTPFTPIPQYNFILILNIQVFCVYISIIVQIQFMVIQCSNYAIIFVVPTQLLCPDIVGFVVFWYYHLLAWFSMYFSLIQLQSHWQVSHSALNTLRCNNVSS